MKTQKENRNRVLGLLYENLHNRHPQVVNIERIAKELRLSLKEARELLLSMDYTGEIQSSAEGDYSLITLSGLAALDRGKEIRKRG